MEYDPRLVTLQRLVRFAEQRDDEVGERLADLGLIVGPRLERPDYWCSPANALTFATTGGDGVHFSLVDLGDGPREDSPVVMTVPMAFGDDLTPNWIVGENLGEFLGLGLHVDYFSLEQIAYDEDWLTETGGSGSEPRPAVVGDLAAELGLRRWPAVAEHIGVLQTRYGNSLDLPDEA